MRNLHTQQFSSQQFLYLNIIVKQVWLLIMLLFVSPIQNIQALLVYYAYMYIHICIHIYVYIYIYLYMCIHIYIYIHFALYLQLHVLFENLVPVQICFVISWLQEFRLVFYYPGTLAGKEYQFQHYKSGRLITFSAKKLEIQNREIVAALERSFKNLSHIFCQIYLMR